MDGNESEKSDNNEGAIDNNKNNEISSTNLTDESHKEDEDNVISKLIRYSIMYDFY